MTYSTLLRSVIRRLDEADRGDHGWFVITRVHLTTARLGDIAKYLFDIGAANGRQVTRADYRSIAQLVEVRGNDPGVQLRRHQFLAMEKPLRLIERTNGRSWQSVTLTLRGINLATASDPAAVLEQILSEIVFCREPFYTPSRVKAYQDFAVTPYLATVKVLKACDGWIDRDEFDLFLSRIRKPSETAWAAAGIHQFRNLDDTKRASLLLEVQSRIPGKKTYQNWRDMGPHHFSFFSLGTSAVRDGNRLLLSTRYLQEGKPEPAKVVAVPAPKVATRAKRKSQLRGLRIPEPNATDELEAPPTTAASNAGTDAEILVGKLLQAAGWAIVYYAGKRGYGFDIWARKGKAAILIEVKSSLGQLGAVTLTRLEYEAAQHHGRNFVLALVENVRENPKVRFVTDPVSRLSIEAKATEAYVIAREAWYPVAEQSWK